MKKMSVRTGIGIDVHKFTRGKFVTLGGVRIPYARSLRGHSDADVIIHAIMDALFGAAGLPDIGVHFPPTDPTLKGISSLVLLRKTVALVKKKKYTIININAAVLAEAPKLSPYRLRMIRALETVTGGDTVSLQFTTTEQLGFIGRREGIAAFATALLEKK